MAKSRPQSKPNPLNPDILEEAQSFSDVEDSAEGLVEETIELSAGAAELVRQLEAERDEALAARTRALADFSNFQRRAVENENRALFEGSARVLRELLPVLDNFDLALNQDVEQLSVEQLSDGVELVRTDLVKVLKSNGIRRIEPLEGAEFDPEFHEAMFRQPREGFAPNSIVSVLQPGYAMGDLVLRPAKVAVAPVEDEASPE